MISQIQTRASRSIVSRSYTLHARLLCCCGDSTVPSRRASLCCVVQTEMEDPTPQEPKQKTSPYLQSSLRTMRLLALASHLLRARLAASGLSLSASHFESLVSHGKKNSSMRVKMRVTDAGNGIASRGCGCGAWMFVAVRGDFDVSLLWCQSSIAREEVGSFVWR